MRIGERWVYKYVSGLHEWVKAVFHPVQSPFDSESSFRSHIDQFESSNTFSARQGLSNQFRGRESDFASGGCVGVRLEKDKRSECSDRDSGRYGHSSIMTR